MVELDFFDLTGLPFDPPIKLPKKVKTAIDKKIKELCISLSVSSQQVKRDEINAQINFLENISEKVFDPDEKKLNKGE